MDFFTILDEPMSFQYRTVCFFGVCDQLTLEFELTSWSRAYHEKCPVMKSSWWRHGVFAFWIQNFNSSKWINFSFFSFPQKPLDVWNSSALRRCFVSLLAIIFQLWEWKEKSWIILSIVSPVFVFFGSYVQSFFSKCCLKRLGCTKERFYTRLVVGRVCVWVYWCLETGVKGRFSPV